MGKLVISQSQSSLGYTFNGFDEAFPRELMGIVPVKEYMRAIEILNSNGRRLYISYYIYAASYFICGIIPILILVIVEAVRWSKFIKNLRKDLEKCCNVINDTMALRQVKFKIDITSSPVGTLTITYPDVQPLIPKETIQLVGGDMALLLPPFADSISIVNPLLYRDENAPTDINYKNLLFRYNDNGMFSMGFYGFNSKYNYSLYNYISPTEFKEITDDINNTLVCDYSENLQKFTKITLYSMFILVGLILALPWSIWLAIERKKLYKNFERKKNELVLKYNKLYNSRGVTFNIVSHLPLMQKPLKEYSLNISFPSDTGNAPVVARISNSNELVLAPFIPNGVGPYFQVMNMV